MATEVGSHAGENIGKGGKLFDYIQSEIETHVRIEDIINFNRNSSSKTIQFNKLLPASIFKRSLVDGCPVLENTCASSNAIEMTMGDTMYMNEEWQPQTVGEMFGAAQLADYIRETGELWAMEETKELMDFLKATFTNEDIDVAEFTANPKLYIFEKIRNLETTTGISRDKFTLLVSQDVADALLAWNAEPVNLFNTSEVERAKQVAQIFGVAAIRTVRISEMPAGVKMMLFVKNLVVGGSYASAAPAFHGINEVGKHPGTTRYYAEETYGFDTFDVRAGLVLTGDEITAPRKHLTEFDEIAFANKIGFQATQAAKDAVQETVDFIKNEAAVAPAEAPAAKAVKKSTK